jgi:hypothetical protein
MDYLEEEADDINTVLDRFDALYPFTFRRRGIEYPHALLIYFVWRTAVEVTGTIENTAPPPPPEDSGEPWKR